MDLKATIDIIIKDLNDIRDIVDDLRQYKGVPAIEIELAKSKCRGVIEIISFLRDNDSFPLGPKQVKSEGWEGSTSVKVEKSSEKAELPMRQEETKESPAKKEDSVAVKEMPLEKDTIRKVEINAPEPEFHESVNKENWPMAGASTDQGISGQTKPAGMPKMNEFTIIADQFANRPESFNEKLGSMKHEDDVLELIKTKPVSTLSEAIGINDKYLFIKEIFNGDQESYNQALAKLESAECLDDAKTIINIYAGENRENEAFKMFISILKRKFPSNE